MRWFRPRPQRLVLRTVQLRVTLADPDVGDETGGTETFPPDPMPMAPEVASISAAPPLAVRPLEDAEWTFHG